VKKHIVFLTLGIAMLLLLAAANSAGQTSAAQATPAATAAGTEEVLCPPSAATAAPGATEAAPAMAATAEGTPAQIARPSNAGGPGPALALKGDAVAGQKIYTDNCQKCHGDQGQGGVENPGSDDGSIPALNPIDDTFKDPDPQVYTCNVDLFIEHGSVPSGPSPKQTMPAWGDEGKLKPQDIANVIAYIISLNPIEATAAPTKSGQ